MASCWQVLEQRATWKRDRVAEQMHALRSQMLEQRDLLDRTQKITAQYQRKIDGFQGSGAHIGDLQLYRTSIRQLQQAAFQIESQVNLLEFELGKLRRQLAECEFERQKYLKLESRAQTEETAHRDRMDAKDLDDFGTQAHARKQKLA